MERRTSLVLLLPVHETARSSCQVPRGHSVHSSNNPSLNIHLHPSLGVKGVDDIGSSNDNKKEKLTMSRSESKVPRSKNWNLKEERTATPRQGISEIAQLRNELRYMQSKCNRLIKEHDLAITNLIQEHKTTIATLTKQHEATIKDMKYYKMMAESKTNLLTSIDETQTSSLGGSDHYDTPRRHSDSLVTSREKVPPAESFINLYWTHATCRSSSSNDHGRRS